MLLFGPLGPPVGVQSPPLDRTERLLVMGDSLSAAYNMAIDEGWVSLMQVRADQLGCAATIINASISGETTAGALTRLPKLLARHKPSIVMVELGGNDALRGLSLDAFRDNLQRMIELTRAAEAEVVLAEIQIPANYGTRYRERFQQIYPELAQAADVELLPFLLNDVALDPALMQADGIHPNAAAQPIILDNVWATVAKSLGCGSRDG